MIIFSKFINNHIDKCYRCLHFANLLEIGLREHLDTFGHPLGKTISYEDIQLIKGYCIECNFMTNIFISISTMHAIFGVFKKWD